jgi:hypothetical protein
MIERLQAMIKVYGYDEERDSDEQPVFFTTVNTWEDAITQVKEKHREEDINDFTILEKFGEDEFVDARIKFD